MTPTLASWLMRTSSCEQLVMTQLPHSCLGPARDASSIVPEPAAPSSFRIYCPLICYQHYSNIEGYNRPSPDVVTAYEATVLPRQTSESLERIMKVTLYNIQASAAPLRSLLHCS